MKTNFPKGWAIGMAIVAYCLGGGQMWQNAKAEDTANSTPPPSSEVTAAPPDSAPSLPPNVYPSSPLAQVIRLLQAGVSEDVIMTYVTNSGSTFNLDPDKIIYMKDVG